MRRVGDVVVCVFRVVVVVWCLSCSCVCCGVLLCFDAGNLLSGCREFVVVVCVLSAVCVRLRFIACCVMCVDCCLRCS